MTEHSLKSIARAGDYATIEIRYAGGAVVTPEAAAAELRDA
jgi:hypothetical protein